MARKDEDLPKEESPEVEGHGNFPGGRGDLPDPKEGNAPRSEDEEPDVEAHGHTPGVVPGGRGNVPSARTAKP